MQAQIDKVAYIDLGHQNDYSARLVSQSATSGLEIHVPASAPLLILEMDGTTAHHRLVVDNANDRVGINTATPSATLGVNGDAAVSGLITGGQFGSLTVGPIATQHGHHHRWVCI